MPTNPYYSETRGEEPSNIWSRIRGFFGAQPAGPPLSEQERKGAPRGRAHQRERERQLREITGEMDRRRR